MSLYTNSLLPPSICEKPDANSSENRLELTKLIQILHNYLRYLTKLTLQDNCLLKRLPQSSTNVLTEYHLFVPTWYRCDWLVRGFYLSPPSLPNRRYSPPEYNLLSEGVILLQIIYTLCNFFLTGHYPYWIQTLFSLSRLPTLQVVKWPIHQMLIK